MEDEAETQPAEESPGRDPDDPDAHKRRSDSDAGVARAKISSNDPPDRQRWRRLHTLSGALALGLFLALHLLTNASALGGEAAYDSVVGSIERWELLPLIEVVIVIPLAFHVGCGIHLLLRRKGTADAEIERYGDRRLWVVQRISALFVLAFVLGHLWELRVQRLFFGLSPSAFHTILSAHLSSTWAGVPWIALLYLFGIAAAAFHFSNGVFAATVVWNIAMNPSGRRRVRIGSITLGLVLFLIGATTVIGLATGTRLLTGRDADSAPCGSAVPATAAPSPSH